MKLAIMLQSAWMPDQARAERLEAMLRDRPAIGYRVWVNLLRNTKTGRGLLPLIDEDDLWEDRSRLVFLETTPKVGVGSSSCPKADPVWAKGVLDREAPDVLIACGQPAQKLAITIWRGRMIATPHPAARFLGPTATQTVFGHVKAILADPPEKWHLAAVSVDRAGALVCNLSPKPPAPPPEAHLFKGVDA